MYAVKLKRNRQKANIPQELSPEYREIQEQLNFVNYVFLIENHSIFVFI